MQPKVVYGGAGNWKGLDGRVGHTKELAGGAAQLGATSCVLGAVLQEKKRGSRPTRLRGPKTRLVLRRPSQAQQTN